MKKLSIFLNIALILGVTTVVFSFRGPVNGRTFNRDKHSRMELFVRVNGQEIDILVLCEGDDSDEVIKSSSVASAARRVEQDGRVKSRVKVWSAVECTSASSSANRWI